MEDTIDTKSLFSLCIQVAQTAGNFARWLHNGSMELSLESQEFYKPSTQSADAHKMIKSTFAKYFPGLPIRADDQDVEVDDTYALPTHNQVFGDIELPEHLQKLPKERLTIWSQPLEGPACFVAGDVNGVTVSLGLSLDTKPIFGVIHHSFDIQKATYWGGEGMKLHRTTAAFQTAGVPARIQKPSENTILMTRYNSSAFINSFFQRLENFTVLQVGGSGFKATLVALGYHSAAWHPSPRKDKHNLCASTAILQSTGGSLASMDGEVYEFGPESEREMQAGWVMANNPEHILEIVKEYSEYKLEFEV